MATETAALINEIRALRDTITSMSSLAAGSDLFKDFRSTIRSASDGTAKDYARMRMEHKQTSEAYDKTEKNLLKANYHFKRVGEGAGGFRKQLSLAEQQVTNFYEGLSASDTEKATSKFRKHLIKANSPLASQVKVGSDLVRIQERLKKQNWANFVVTRRLFKQRKISDEEATKRAEEAGFTFEDLTKTTDELKREQTELAQATVSTRRSMVKATDAFASASSAFGGVITWASALYAGAIKPWADIAESMARLGTRDMGIIDLEMDARLKLGMSAQELAELQNKHAHTIASSSSSYQEFVDTISKGATEMQHLTGTIADAGKLQAQSYEYAKTLGADQDSFIASMNKSFKTLHNSIGTTVEQFMNMNEQFMESSEIQAQLYKMDVRRRAGYFQELHVLHKRLVTMGLQDEAAVDMIKTMAGYGKEKPLERIKKAAGMRVLGTNLGIDPAVIDRAQKDMLSGKTATEAMAQFKQQGNIRMGQMQERGLGSEIVFRGMAEKLGLEDMIGFESEGAKFNLRQEQRMNTSLEQQAMANKMSVTRDGLLSDLLYVDQVVVGLLKGPIVGSIAAIGASVFAIPSLLGGIGSTLVGIGIGLAGLASGFAAALIPGIKGIVGGLASKLVGELSLLKGVLAGKTGATLAKGGAIAAGAYGAYQAGQAIITGRSDVHDALVSTEMGATLSDGIGAGITKGLAFFGNDAAQETLDMLEKQRERASQLQSLDDSIMPSGGVPTVPTPGAVSDVVNRTVQETMGKLAPTKKDMEFKEASVKQGQELLDYHKERDSEMKKIEEEKKRRAQELYDIMKKIEEETKKGTKATEDQTKAENQIHEDDKELLDKNWSIHWRKAKMSSVSNNLGALPT